MRHNGEQISTPASSPSEDARLAEELTETGQGAIRISGDRHALDYKLGIALPDAGIAALFGGIRDSQIEIQPDGLNVDVWTSNDWFESPLYFSVERDAAGITQTINDFFLLEKAPRTLGTRMIARMVFQAMSIPKFIAIQASASRLYALKDGGGLREVNGYYFFPRLGFTADPKNADDFIEIPKTIKGKKLLSIMRDPDLRQWWKENGQTIEVHFRMGSKRSARVLRSYLHEKGINLSIGDTFENR
jgi:hypothetical protein